jgi:hypothetical protein
VATALNIRFIAGMSLGAYDASLAMAIDQVFSALTSLASSYSTLVITFVLFQLSAVTVIVAVPFFTPFTTPFSLTVATLGSELVQV